MGIEMYVTTASIVPPAAMQILYTHGYKVATISRLLKTIGLFCRIQFLS